MANNKIPAIGRGKYEPQLADRKLVTETVQSTRNPADLYANISYLHEKTMLIAWNLFRPSTPII